MVAANSSCPLIFLTELFPLQYTVSFVKNESSKLLFDALVLKQLDKSLIEESSGEMIMTCTASVESLRELC